MMQSSDAKRTEVTTQSANLLAALLLMLDDSITAEQVISTPHPKLL